MKTNEQTTKLLLGILLLLAIIATIAVVKAVPILAIFIPGLLVELKWKVWPKLKKQYLGDAPTEEEVNK